MANPLDNINELANEHPYLIVGLVVLVAGFAYLSSRGRGSTQAVTFAGGGAAPGIDPNAAAIEEAAIAAGTQNVGLIASLLGTKDTNASALSASLAQSSAARDIAVTQANDALQGSLAATSAQEEASLAQTAAQREAALAAISANQETTDAQTSASVTISGQQTAAQIAAAQLTADTQRAAITSSQQIAQQQIAAQLAAQNNTNQTAKNISRANNNTSIVQGILDLAGGALAFFHI